MIDDAWWASALSGTPSPRSCTAACDTLLSGDTLLDNRTVVDELMLRVSSTPTFLVQLVLEDMAASWLRLVEGDATTLFICHFELGGFESFTRWRDMDFIMMLSQENAQKPEKMMNSANSGRCGARSSDILMSLGSSVLLSTLTDCLSARSISHVFGHLLIVRISSCLRWPPKDGTLRLG